MTRNSFRFHNVICVECLHLLLTSTDLSFKVVFCSDRTRETDTFQLICLSSVRPYVPNFRYYLNFKELEERLGFLINTAEALGLSSSSASFSESGQL
jgi:hypothetical protein